MTTKQSTDVHQLAARMNGGEAELIDVRTPVEFREIHAAAARNVPLDKLDPRAIMADRDETRDEPVYVICRSGARSEKAQQLFIDAGFTNVINVAGGTDAWVAANLPVVRGAKAISLERQVRIAAGALVFTGALLSLLVHPYWAGLPLFVGAGLVFAGVSDTCAMGMLLAKMPWNQVGEDSCCTGSQT